MTSKLSYDAGSPCVAEGAYPTARMHTTREDGTRDPDLETWSVTEP